MTRGSAPLLKWPGGKRWLAPIIVRAVRRHLNVNGRYFEPFAGGAAVFFALQPRQAIVADVNDELIATYATVRDDHDAVAAALRRLSVTRQEYYRIRASRPRTCAGRAARFLYLNRTAFAGMYRLNKRGEFNVPYGGGSRTPACLLSAGILGNAAAALVSADLRVADFEETMASAGEGDVIYCDPTYTVAHNNNGFVRYNERNFNWKDQQRLAVTARLAAERGAFVVVSNAHHASVAELYRGWRLRVVTRNSMICPRREARKQVSEYLLMSQSYGGGD